MNIKGTLVALAVVLLLLIVLVRSCESPFQKFFDGMGERQEKRQERKEDRQEGRKDTIDGWKDWWQGRDGIFNRRRQSGEVEPEHET